MLRRRRKVGNPAFTLVEMVVVTAIIALMAGLILPNMVAIKQSRELRTEQAAIQRLPTEARNAAMKYKQTVDLRVEGDYLLMERTDPSTSDATEIKRIAIGSQLQVQSAQLQVAGITPQPDASTSTDVASWKWSVYPDGTSDTGGLTFAVGPRQQQQALYIPAGLNARWSIGDLPQPTDTTWTAGELEQRAVTSTSTTGGGGQAGGAGGTGGR